MQFCVQLCVQGATVGFVLLPFLTYLPVNLISTIVMGAPHGRDREEVYVY